VETAGHLVAAAVAELATGVQDGQDDLDRGPALALHHRHGDAAAVVRDRDRVVGVDGDRDLAAVTGERLVHRVVHHLVDEVMQAAHAGRTDVHARALAHGLEALEDRDVLGVVASAPAAVGGVDVRQVEAFRLHKPRPGGTTAVRGRGVAVQWS
jgi:hypothetical protein